MVETKINIVKDEIQRVIREYNSNNADSSIPNVELDPVSKYLNKIVVTFLNKHLIFCKKSSSFLTASLPNTLSKKS